MIREATIELDENIEDTSQTSNSEGDEYLAQQHDRTFGKLSASHEKGHKRSNSRFNQVHNFDFRYLSQDEKPRDAVLLHKRQSTMEKPVYETITTTEQGGNQIQGISSQISGNQNQQHLFSAQNFVGSIFTLNPKKRRQSSCSNGLLQCIKAPYYEDSNAIAEEFELTGDHLTDSLMAPTKRLEEHFEVSVSNNILEEKSEQQANRHIQKSHIKRISCEIERNALESTNNQNQETQPKQFTGRGQDRPKRETPNRSIYHQFRK